MSDISVASKGDAHEATARQTGPIRGGVHQSALRRFMWRGDRQREVAIHAGYAPKGAHVQACCLLKKPNVRAAIDKGIKEQVGQDGQTLESRPALVV